MVQHIPGHKNKAADCLSRLPFVTMKRNNHPIKDKVSLSKINECDKPTDIYFSLCEIDLKKTKELQQSNKHCIRIAKLMADAKGRFSERYSYGYDDSGLLYHLNRENGIKKKPQLYQRALSKHCFRRCMTILVTLELAYSLVKRYYYWPKMIKHIQAHVNSCSLCRREKL